MNMTAKEYYETLPKDTPFQSCLKKLDEVYREFSFRLEGLGEVVIAGGAVRDALLGQLPKDYDVFVLNNYHSYKELTAKIIERLGSNIPQWTIHPIDLIPSNIQSLSETIKKEDDYKGRVAANCFNVIDNKIVQIITSGCSSLKELIDTFDWTICMHGYDGNVISKYPIDDQIGLGKDLILNSTDTPLNTLRRGFRFSERFQMNIPNNTILLLCAKILETDKNGKRRAEHMEFLQHLKNGAGDRN